jgi:hypothetical protein
MKLLLLLLLLLLLCGPWKEPSNMAATNTKAKERRVPCIMTRIWPVYRD